MCEFCLKHGAGRTWYLEARNYSRDLIRNERKFRQLVQWLTAGPTGGTDKLGRLRQFRRIPIIGSALSWFITRRMKRIHFGQVLTLQDVRKVFGLVDAIVGFPCMCRRYLLDRHDERYCFGLGQFMKEIIGDMPDVPDNLGETLSAEEACQRAEAFEAQGLVHTIWTLDTPFIVGICSCKPGECLAMEMTQGLRTPVMFKGEYRFEIDASSCIGCRKCMETCYFEAIVPHEREKLCAIDPAKCYGCGLCQRACPVDAARSVPR